MVALMPSTLPSKEDVALCILKCLTLVNMVILAISESLTINQIMGFKASELFIMQMKETAVGASNK